MDKKQDIEKIENVKIPPKTQATPPPKASGSLKDFADEAVVLGSSPATKKGTVMVRSLHIRKDHTRESEGVGGLVAGNEVTIYETFVDGDDTWARIGEGQWAAMIYNGETYKI